MSRAQHEVWVVPADSPATNYLEPDDDGGYVRRSGTIMIPKGTKILLGGPVIEIISGVHDGIRLFQDDGA